MHVYLQYANNKKNTNIVVHYIGLANYGKAGWASVAMPILPSACMSKISDDLSGRLFLLCDRVDREKWDEWDKWEIPIKRSVTHQALALLFIPAPAHLNQRTNFLSEGLQMWP